jgi:hypothetical protein
MPEAPRTQILANFIFDPEYTDPDPARNRFYEAVRTKVQGIVDEYGSPEEIENLPSRGWNELRNRLLGINMTLTPEGDIKDE